MFFFNGQESSHAPPIMISQLREHTLPMTHRRVCHLTQKIVDQTRLEWLVRKIIFPLRTATSSSKRPCRILRQNFGDSCLTFSDQQVELRQNSTCFVKTNSGKKAVSHLKPALGVAAKGVFVALLSACVRSVCSFSHKPQKGKAPTLFRKRGVNRVTYSQKS